jgi:hypothetical protein
MTSGLYTGGTFGFPTSIGGIGGGFYVDTNENTVTVHLTERAFLLDVLPHGQPHP